MNFQYTFSKLYKNLYEKRFNFITACFCVLLNWAGHSFVYESSYRFLTFDMVGTFVIAMTLGSIWAILVAITTPIVLSNITSPHFIYVALIHMTGAFFWGWLAESGNLKIFNTKSKSKNDLKNTVLTVSRFILFAGIATGLVVSFSSSVIKNVIFQDAIFKQPYSIYFTELFRNIFGIDNSGIYALMANYIAETFIEIPNMILTVFIGSVICLTILKYNTTMLTEHYEQNLRKKQITWFNIFMSNISRIEFFLFIILGYLYITTVKSVSNNVLSNIISQMSTRTFQDFLFLEMITIPLIVIILILFLKIILPAQKVEMMNNLLYLKRSILNKKEYESDITRFILTLFILSIAVVTVYIAFIVQITGINPIRYYRMMSEMPANISNFLWLIILLITFILIDKYNNNLTRTITMENELIKKETISEISDSFDTQRQKLQILELNWSQDTVELLKSSRHDLVNQLEKTKTGFDGLLYEIYEKIVKPYKEAILENQKNTREHIEELSEGKLNKTNLQYIDDNLKEQVTFYNDKLKPYINISMKSLKEPKEYLYCYTNRLIFVAVKNIIDNSIFALQKLLINDNFKAKLNIDLDINASEKNLIITITDNAGGIEDSVLSKIYKQQIQSSKGQRLGEGTIHSAYFIGISNGFIKAKNINAGGERGLQTCIILPVYKNAHKEKI